MKIRHAAAAALAAAALMSTAAHAQPASRTANTTATTAAASSASASATSDNRRVCVRYVLTASIVRPLVCRTRQSWMATEGFVPGERPHSALEQAR